MTAGAFLVAVLAGVAAWLVTPAWREDRAQRLHGRPSRSLSLAGVWHEIEGRWRVGPAARRREARRRMQVIQALSALAAELTSGQPPASALAHCGGEPSAWPAAAQAARTGDDVAAALLVDAHLHPVLRQLAACWQVAVDSGAGLAAAVTALAASTRVAEDVRVQLEAELAGPRATARTLAMLPVVGIGFGVMMGADPLGWLLGSTPGLLCLTAGLALTGLGAWWTGRIAARVESML